jgi:hypothetical protein
MTAIRTRAAPRVRIGGTSARYRAGSDALLDTSTDRSFMGRVLLRVPMTARAGDAGDVPCLM